MKMLRAGLLALISLCVGLPLLAQTVPIVMMSFPANLPGNLIPQVQYFLDQVSNPSALVGNVSWLWADTNPIAGLPNFAYWSGYRNSYGVNNLQCTGCVTGGTNPQWDWFLAHHPDQVEYLNDQKTPAWVPGTYTYVPLNFQDPNVYSFVTTGAGSGGAATNLSGLLHNVYSGGLRNVGIALDNITNENNQYYAGHFQGAVPGPNCTETNPTCGGTWVQDFCSGTGGEPSPIGTFPYCSSNIDPGFASATVVWTQKLHNWVNSQGGLMNCNNEVTTAAISVTIGMVCGDLVTTEGPFMDGNGEGGCSDTVTPFLINLAHDWLPRYQYYRSVGASVGIGFSDYLCAGYNPNNEPASLIAWGTANFLLDRGGKAWYSVRDEAGGYAPFTASFKPPCGTGAWTQTPATWSYLNSGGSYERVLTVGPSDPPGTDLCYVEVNPNVSANTTYTLPSGTWVDQFGNTIPAGTNTLGPTAGIIAVKVG